MKWNFLTCLKGFGNFRNEFFWKNNEGNDQNYSTFYLILWEKVFACQNVRKVLRIKEQKMLLQFYYRLVGITWSRDNIKIKVFRVKFRTKKDFMWARKKAKSFTFTNTCSNRGLCWILGNANDYIWHNIWMGGSPIMDKVPQKLRLQITKTAWLMTLSVIKLGIFIYRVLCYVKT